MSRKHCKTIAVANQKGGVGKTTTAYCLAYELGHRGYRVLLVDSDSQGNASQNSGISEFGNNGNHFPSLVMQALAAGENFSIDDPQKYLLKCENLDILPSDETLSAVEIEMTMNIRANPKTIYVMRWILDNYKEDYDFIIIDCLPSLLTLVRSALGIADSVLIPVTPQYFSIKGLQLLLKNINLVRRGMNPRLQIEGILITMCTSYYQFTAEMVDAIRNVFGQHIRIFDTSISCSVLVSKAQASGKCILAYRRWHKVSKQYIHFVDEFLKG